MTAKEKANIATHVYLSEDILWEDSPITPGMYEIFEVLDEGISIYFDGLQTILWEDLKEASFRKKVPCGGAAFAYKEVEDKDPLEGVTHLLITEDSVRDIYACIVPAGMYEVLYYELDGDIEIQHHGIIGDVTVLNWDSMKSPAVSKRRRLPYGNGTYYFKEM
jgi:hypothetical protein